MCTASLSVNATACLISGSNNTFLEDVQDPYMSKMGDNWDIIIGLIILFIIMAGVSLNSLVLWTLVRAKGARLQHHLTSTDSYIITLAVSDLLVVLLCYPFAFVSTISHGWLFGDVGCAINGFFGFLFSLIDIGVLTMMSLLRLLSVKMPHCAFVKSPRYTAMTLIGVVLYALVWTMSPLLGWGHFAPEPFGTSCTVDWKNPDRSYVTAVFVGVLAVPLLTMLTCYSSIIYHMQASSLKLGPFLAERKKRAKRQNRLVRIAVLMCVCFMVIWTPYSVLSICFSYVPSCDVYPVHSAIPTVLAKMSHLANPVICFTMNKSYRKRIKCFCLGHSLFTLPENEDSKSCRTSHEVQTGKTSEYPTQLPASACISQSPSIPLLQFHGASKPKLECQNTSSASDEDHIHSTEYSIEDSKDNNEVTDNLRNFSHV